VRVLHTGGGDERALAKKVLLLDVLHLVAWWAEDGVLGQREQGCTPPVDVGAAASTLQQRGDAVVFRDLFLASRRLQIRQGRTGIAEAKVAHATVEEHLARAQLEFQSQLRVINVHVASQVQQSVVEVLERALPPIQPRLAQPFEVIPERKVFVLEQRRHERGDLYQLM
jgi:hypothetical protein